MFQPYGISQRTHVCQTKFARFRALRRASEPLPDAARKQQVQATTPLAPIQFN